MVIPFSYAAVAPYVGPLLKPRGGGRDLLAPCPDGELDGDAGAGRSLRPRDMMLSKPSSCPRRVLYLGTTWSRKQLPWHLCRSLPRPYGCS